MIRSSPDRRSCLLRGTDSHLHHQAWVLPQAESQCRPPMLLPQASIATSAACRHHPASRQWYAIARSKRRGSLQIFGPCAFRAFGAAEPARQSAAAALCSRPRTLIHHVDAPEAAQKIQAAPDSAVTTNQGVSQAGTGVPTPKWLAERALKAVTRCLDTAAAICVGVRPLCRLLAVAEKLSFPLLAKISFAFHLCTGSNDSQEVRLTCRRVRAVLPSHSRSRNTVLASSAGRVAHVHLATQAATGFAGCMALLGLSLKQVPRQT